MKQFLITQWNCDFTDLGWLERRQKLFEKFTVPSVMSQTNKDFEWILVSDIRTPDKFKKVLDSYPATVIYYDWEGYEWPTVEIDGISPTDKMYRSVQLEYIKPVLVEHIGRRDDDFIITSRLDNDDAIAIDHIERIQQAAYKYRTHESKFWVSLVRGYKWNNGKVYPKNSNRNPYVSFVETPEDLQTCYQCCHTLCDRTAYPIHCIREGTPTWLQVIHGENLLNKQMRFKGEKSDYTIRDRFKFK